MNRDLFLAILSMDSYNRGYGAAVNLPAGATHIGLAEILPDSEQRPSITGGQAAGFYALAYDVSGAGIAGLGGTVIAYRGTDQIGGLDGDLLNGWTLGGNLPNQSQGALAIAFYEAVVSSLEAGNPRSIFDQAIVSTTLTGHSLRRRLAGNDNDMAMSIAA